MSGSAVIRGILNISSLRITNEILALSAEIDELKRGLPMDCAVTNPVGLNFEVLVAGKLFLKKQDHDPALKTDCSNDLELD